MAQQICISLDEAKHIARLPKYRGHEFLARKLRLGLLDEEDLKSGLIVDYVYDVLQYATNRGFPWREVSQSVGFALEFLHRSQGLQFPDAVRLLQDTAARYIRSRGLCLQNAKLLCQYFTTNFLAHFRLYQYVLSWPQEQRQANITVTVECPPEIMDLTTAQTMQAWEYENKMRMIDQDEARRKDSLKRVRTETASKDDKADYELKVKFLEGELQAVALNDAEKLISELASEKLSLVKQDVGHSITELKDTASVAIARRAVKVPSGIVDQHAGAPKSVVKPKSSISRKSSSNSSKKH